MLQYYMKKKSKLNRLLKILSPTKPNQENMSDTPVSLFFCGCNPVHDITKVLLVPLEFTDTDTTDSRQLVQTRKKDTWKTSRKISASSISSHSSQRQDRHLNGRYCCLPCTPPHSESFLTKSVLAHPWLGQLHARCSHEP